MVRNFFGRINHSAIWKRSVTVRGASFLPPTLDRWVVLQAHRFGLMGTDDIRSLKTLVRPDSRIADVGANQGIYTLFFSHLVSSGHVFAFEPDPALFSSLKENVRRNRANNVTLFNAAAASQTGKLFLRPGLLNRGDNQVVQRGQVQDVGAVQVDALSLDQTIPDRRLDLLKIDVQGFEVEVLKGAQELIAANPRLSILIEFWPHGLYKAGSCPEELLDILLSAGFSVSRNAEGPNDEPFTYRAKDWSLPAQYCNLVATKGRIAGE
jgi:FkbM family methyltransferase